MTEAGDTSESPSNEYVGKPVAAFEAMSIDDRTLSSSSHGAKVLIIELWGINCGSCIDEMKALEGIYKEYRDSGLKIWAINTEDIGARQIAEEIKARKLDISYDVIADPGLTITKIFTSWFIPVTVIVDSGGVVQYYKIGFNEADAEKIKAKVGALLAP